MRPRPEGRGERRSGAIEPLMRRSFNAATARRPWRTRRRRPGRRARRASMRPRPEGRGERDADERPDKCAGASMRPRPEGRGERPVCRSARRCNVQGFNAATARRPWRTRVAARRRRLETSFNAATARRPWRTRTPARRRDARSFNAATARRPWRTAVRSGDGGCRTASMRPRPEGRGERAALTCGRHGRRRLQCGHGPKAVENARRRRADGLPSRFNAATARRPWRTSPASWRPAADAAASMRPRPEGRGEPAVANDGACR